jgi:hypothetical protein
MKPALYSLTAQHNGYIHLPGKTGMRREDENVALKPGQQLTDFIVEMTPRALIAGRVVDEYGDPVQNMEVEAVPAAAGSQTARSGMGALTDERGQFRMTGAPGKYFVKASELPNLRTSSEIRTSGPAPPVYGTTFYPSTTNKDRASVVEVAAGHDLTGVDIRLARTLSLSVSGVVTGMPDSSGHAYIVLLSDGQTDQVRLYAPVVPDGKFTVSRLAPGRYRIWASQGSGDSLFLSQPVEVNLESTDETNLSLQLLPGEELSGTLEIQDDPAKSASVETLTVGLEQYTEAHRPKGGEADGSGAFRLAQVFPAKFRVTVRPMPENAYIKSVKLDDTEMPDGVLDLSRGVGGAKLKVTVSLNGGQLEGTVLGEDGKPFSGPLAFVFLAATAEEIDNQSGTPIAPDAKFRFTGLHPGKYRLFAVDPKQVSGDTEGFKTMFPKAEEIEINEGGRIVKDVKVMAAENPNAKP